MIEYDGWVLKIDGEKMLDTIARKRREIIDELESEGDEHWETLKRSGRYEIVKIKLVEV